MAQQYEYAGIGARFLALLIDAIILGIIMAPFMMMGIFSVGVGNIAKGNFDMSGFFVIYAIAIVFQIVYFTVLEGVKGQTIGKMALNIKVVGYDGREIGMAKAFIRNLLRVIDGLFFYLVGIVFILSGEKRQRIGDRAAGDVVVSLRKSSGFTPEAPQAPQAQVPQSPQF